MSYTVNWLTKVISIPTADLSLVSGTRYRLIMSNFLSEIRRLEWASNEGLWADQILAHTNAKTMAGITFAPFDEVINGYTIQFTGIATRVDLDGSNNNITDVLIATGIMLVPSNSAGLIGLSDITERMKSLQRYVEALRPHHTGFGNTWYYDPSYGADTNDGKSPESGFLTMAATHAAARDYGNDVIFIVPKGDGPTICNDPWNITKSYLFIRGVGYNTHVHPTTTTAGGNLIEISGNGVELSGMHIEGVNLLATPNVNGIVVTGHHVLLEDVTIEECTGHGVVMTTPIGHEDRAHISRCHIRANTKSGLQYNQGNHLEVTDSDFEDNGEHGVDLTGAGASEDVLFHHTNFLRNTGYGLKINNANVVGTTIDADCFSAFNGSGSHIDNGTNSIFQKVISNAAIATAVGSRVVEGTFTHDEVMRLVASALAGKVSGAGTGTEVFRDLADSKNRVTFTTDANGNRLGVALDAT